MPLFDEGGNTGASYQNAWEAFTGLFDKERHGDPNPQEPEGKHDDDKKKKKKSGKWF